MKIMRIVKSKYKRRRAIKCKLVEKSKNNPGYCKYMVTIAELDGTVHQQPAYGKDMQDALSRLMNKERTVKIEKKLSKMNPFIVFLIWLGVMGWPAFLMETENSPRFLFYSFAGIVTLVLLGSWWYNYVHKGE